jgi:SAM-dependent methyltransferase
VPFDFHAAYDELNAADHDYRFYAELARKTSARSVLDLGCGTGTLARLLACAGCAVVAIDPDPKMLSVAREKATATGGRVDWRQGYSDSADPCSVDLAVMSGHVAQVFLETNEWLAVLVNLHQALTRRGILAFETRNPAAKAWERWTREETLRTVLTPEGQVEFWHETVDVRLPLVAYDTVTRNLISREETRDRDVLAFRSLGSVTSTLHRTGFEIIDVFGDWSRGPVTPQAPELIVLAKKT